MWFSDLKITPLRIKNDRWVELCYIRLKEKRMCFFVFANERDDKIVAEPSKVMSFEVAGDFRNKLTTQVIC